jgi:hypothetical protein
MESERGEADKFDTGWARYMEWMHNVEVTWTSKKTFKAAGMVEAAASI